MNHKGTEKRTTMKINNRGTEKPINIGMNIRDSVPL